MKKKYYPETGKTEWTLDSWGQKTLYVLGWVSFVYLAACFAVGFFIGIAEML